MRIRKKLIFLHTLFSLGLAAALLIALRPAIGRVVRQAELNEAKLILKLVLADELRTDPREPLRASIARPGALPETVEVRFGTAAELRLPADVQAEAASAVGVPVSIVDTSSRATMVAALAGPGEPRIYAQVAVSIPEARDAVVTLYILLTACLLAVYALVAVALEVFVLPAHVYAPIRRMLDAERAVREGRRDEEIIPANVIPADELGEIMRSRNESILSLRTSQRALADALTQLEVVATDLKKKNHLLEAARRNLADADRLASMGMMSAGIAHELNTPLAVLKGLVEKLNIDPRSGMDPASAALMLRVVGRLERLSESLLDFARVRPPIHAECTIRRLVDEAATLVRLDRGTHEVDIVNDVPESVIAECDGDRIVQVFVNLLRNGVDALRRRAAENTQAQTTRSAALAPDQTIARALAPSASTSRPGRIVIDARRLARDGSDWVFITVTDNGPGIAPEVLSRLFEPFVTSRMDANGTGLGLAVSLGIIREHGGLLVARNLDPGAVFEIMLPARAPGYADDQPQTDTQP